MGEQHDPVMADEFMEIDRSGRRIGLEVGRDGAQTEPDARLYQPSEARVQTGQTSGAAKQARAKRSEGFHIRLVTLFARHDDDRGPHEPEKSTDDATENRERERERERVYIDRCSSIPPSSSSTQCPLTSAPSLIGACPPWRMTK